MPTLPHPTADIATNGLDIDSTSQSEQPEIKHIRVYLTGYGPFRSITNNPSSGITQSFLPTTTIDIHPTAHLTLRITLQPHPSAVRVAYADVDTLIPEIYDTESFDYILHVGAGLPGGYELEKIAHGDGYYMGDVDGIVPGGGKAKTDEALKKEGLLHHWGGDGSGGTGKGEWMGTGLDVDWIVEMVQNGKIKLTANSENDKSQYTAVIVTEHEEKSDTKTAATTRRVSKHIAAKAINKKAITPKTGYKIRASSDAGRYLCEYIFRKSLEQAISRRKKGARKPWNWHNDTQPSSLSLMTDAREKENISKRVLFMHVPPTGNIYSIPEGIDCLKQVVVGIVLDGEGLRKR